MNYQRYGLSRFKSSRILYTFFHMFCETVQLQYVSVDTYGSQQMLANIYLAFSKLKMIYTVRGKKVTHTPVDLFSIITAFLLFFSSNAVIIIFLVTLIFNNLPLDLQEVVQLGDYVITDFFTLTTSLL